MHARTHTPPHPPTHIARPHDHLLDLLEAQDRELGLKLMANTWIHVVAGVAGAGRGGGGRYGVCAGRGWVRWGDFGNGGGGSSGSGRAGAGGGWWW